MIHNIKANIILDTLRRTKAGLLHLQLKIYTYFIYLKRTLSVLLFNKEKNIKVFGVGMPKTGTTTLGVTLDTLGFRHHTYDMELTRQVRKGNLKEAYNRINKFDSFEDWPWFLIYKELDVKYPNAKFILTTRVSTQAYIKSLQKHHKRQGVTTNNFEKPLWWNDVFDFEPGEWDYDNAAQEYQEHNREVKEYFRGRPDKLIELCWEKGDGWDKLCAFVKRKKPNIPFPHKNKSS